MRKTKRLSARITESTVDKLKKLIKQSGSSMSEVIAKAVDRYYESCLQEDCRPYEIFKKSGFLGVGVDDPDASVNYKSLLSQSLRRKYGHR